MRITQCCITQSLDPGSKSVVHDSRQVTCNGECGGVDAVRVDEPSARNLAGMKCELDW